jgi:hypothetical protein
MIVAGSDRARHCGRAGMSIVRRFLHGERGGTATGYGRVAATPADAGR